MTPVTVVLKIGGELLENGTHLRTLTAAIAGAASPLVVVHGGGKEIDAALQAAGVPKRQVDGLRITDAATLDIVVSVLAGSVNTRLVAALGAAGVRAVGLTGADGRCGLAEVAPPHRTVDGRTVDLGLVGVPSAHADVRLVETLVGSGFVPVIACIGVDACGCLLNVNADTLASDLAARLGAGRLVIAGATAGVLREDGSTIPSLDAAAIGRAIAGGTATAGMIAKLRACVRAIEGGVAEVAIVDGRADGAIAAAFEGTLSAGATRIAFERAAGAWAAAN